jgi:hypothetical protein
VRTTAFSFQVVRPVGDVWYWAAWTAASLREGYRPDAEMAGEAAANARRALEAEAKGVV